MSFKTNWSTAQVPADRAGSLYRRLLGYSRRYTLIIVLASLFMVLDSAATAAFTALLQPIIDRGFGAQDAAFIARLPLLLMLIFVGRAVASFGSGYLMGVAGRSVIRDLRERLFARYLDMPTRFYDRESSGQLIARLTYNIEQIAEAASSAITILVKDTLLIAFLVAVMFTQSVKLSLLILLVGPAIAALVVVVGRRFRRISRRIQDTIGDVSHRASEVIGGHRDIKIYGGAEQERALFASINQANRRQFLKLIATRAGSTAIVQVAAGGALAAIVFLATREAMMAEVTAGRFTTLITAMLGTLPSLKRLTNVNALIQRGVAAADSVFTVIDQAGETDTGTRPLQRARGRIEFDQVGLSYADDSARVLDDVSFVAEPGQVTAIVGRSGGGKSSLVDLVARFYLPSAGVVRVDDVDVNEYRLADYRAQIAYVGQQVVLFADTVANNIAYGDLARRDRDAMIAAARSAHALEFIEALPHGFDTRLGAGGVQLSGGERQRLAIARAILKNAPILILDEATSALDSESERAIQAALEEIMKNRTSLVIAHRLSTIEAADQVIVLDGGRVMESGSHASLLAAGGLYASLHEMQSANGSV